MDPSSKPWSKRSSGQWSSSWDYVQLDFSAERFSAYVWPTVTIGDTTLHFGDRGFRDALCAFITHEVLFTDESPEVGLVIRFGLGEIVTNPGPTETGWR